MNTHLSNGDAVSAPIAALLPLPDWLSLFAAGRAKPNHAWHERIQHSVTQTAPALAYGLAPQELDVVKHILQTRMSLFGAHLPLSERAETALDAWLAASVTRSIAWSAEQRRLWWHLERLGLVNDVLTRWTQGCVVMGDPDEIAVNIHHIAKAGQCWIAHAEELREWGAGVRDLWAWRASEGLLDCLRATGKSRLLSLRQASRNTQARS